MTFEKVRVCRGFKGLGESRDLITAKFKGYKKIYGIRVSQLTLQACGVSAVVEFLYKVNGASALSLPPYGGRFI